MMTAIEFFNAVLKHRNVPAMVWWALSNMAEGALDRIIDDYTSDIHGTSKTLYELYYLKLPDQNKITNLKQVTDAAFNAYEELKKILIEAAKIEDGDHVDTDELDKMAEKEEWSEETKSQCFWDDVQMQWDAFIEDLEDNYSKDVKTVFEDDDKIRWQYTYEVTNILRRIENQLGEIDPIDEEDLKYYINNEMPYGAPEIDFDKPIKSQILTNIFEE